MLSRNSGIIIINIITIIIVILIIIVAMQMLSKNVYGYSEALSTVEKYTMN